MVASPAEAAEVAECLSRLERSLATPSSALPPLDPFSPAVLEVALRGLVRGRGRDALPLLEALAARAATKAVRTLARREIYRLSRAGITLERTPPRPLVERRPERPIRAWVSAIDGSGSRGVWILFETGYGQWELCSLILNDGSGILEAGGGPISRKRFDAELQSLRRCPGLPWIEVSTARAIGLVVETLAAHDPGRPLPSHLARWRPHFTPEAAVAAGAAAEPIPPEDNEDPSLLDRSAELLDLPELGGWFIYPAGVEADALHLLQSRESRLVLSEQIKAEQEAAIVDRVIEREFSPEVRNRWAYRLAETSAILRATGRDREATLARATSAALRDPSRPPRHLPFVRVLAMRGLTLACEVASGRISATEVSRLRGQRESFR